MTDAAMPIALLEWRPLIRNSLRGFATVRLGKSLKIIDVPVHCSYGRRWAQLPSKPQLDKEGVARKDGSGKVQYSPVIAWIDKETADRFSEGVIAAIEREHPNATAENATAG